MSTSKLAEALEARTTTLAIEVGRQAAAMNDAEKGTDKHFQAKAEWNDTLKRWDCMRKALAAETNKGWMWIEGEELENALVAFNFMHDRQASTPK